MSRAEQNTGETFQLERQRFVLLPLELLASCSSKARKPLVFVYSWLWYHAGQIDSYPSVSRLSLECGMSMADIRAAIKELLFEGWITCKKTTGPKGVKTYRITADYSTIKRPRKQKKGSFPPAVSPVPDSDLPMHPLPMGTPYPQVPPPTHGYPLPTGTPPYPQVPPKRPENDPPGTPLQSSEAYKTAETDALAWNLSDSNPEKKVFHRPVFEGSCAACSSKNGHPASTAETCSCRRDPSESPTPETGGLTRKIPLEESRIDSSSNSLSTSKVTFLKPYKLGHQQKHAANDSTAAAYDPDISNPGQVQPVPPLTTLPPPQIVVQSASNLTAPQQHDSPLSSLPPCAEPYRHLLAQWWASRSFRHRSLQPDQPLAQADLDAISLAHAHGVLEPFLAQAAAAGWKSLAYRVKIRIQQLQAGPAAAADFDRLRSQYLAAPNRVPCQSLPRAQKELALILKEGYSIDQILAALTAETAAQAAKLSKAEFCPSMPDIARWLKERRFAAYIQAPTSEPRILSPADFTHAIDEDGEPDPFAYSNYLEACKLQGLI